jgi:hypothetical protein
MTNSTSVFKPNRDMIATPRLEAARANAREAITVTGVAVNAVARRDWDVLEMACNANQQPTRRIDALDDALGGAA